MIDRIEGKATGTETGFGITPQYAEITWTGLDFTPAQFDSVTSLDQAAWKDEFALHTELFNQLAYHLPAALVETKARLEAQLAA
jgi:phosphoenolpyruvate carboxykinase (GTP)